MRLSHVKLVSVSAVRIGALTLLEQGETESFLAQIGDLGRLAHQRVALLVLGDDIGVFVGGAPRRLD